MSNENKKLIRLQIRRNDFITDDSVLLDGEPGLKDGIFKIGDGVTKWSELNSASDSSCIATTIDSEFFETLY